MAGQDPWQIVPASSPVSAGPVEVPVRLDADETLIWTGRPRLARYARPSLFGFLSGLLITAFSLAWIVLLYLGLDRLMEHVRWLAVPLSFLPCCGVPFLLMGGWILLSPLWRWRAGRRTFYLLTNRRAIVCEPGWGQSMAIFTYSPHALSRMMCVEWPDGTGDLVFEEHVAIEAEVQGHRTGHPVRRGFLGIDRVRAVEQLVRQTLRL